MQNQDRRASANVTYRERGTYPGIRPAPHDLTLLEVFGIPAKSNVNRYCGALADYISGKLSTYGKNALVEMWARSGTRGGHSARAGS